MQAGKQAQVPGSSLLVKISAGERRQGLALDPEQLRLLERVHLDFVRAGAKLDAKSQARYAQVMERLAELSTTFAQNVLADESSYRLVLRTEEDLAGLPGFVRAAARQAAADRGIHDAHVITLSRSHIVPFLTFSSRRDLREQAYKAWTSRGEQEGAHDNRPIRGTRSATAASCISGVSWSRCWCWRWPRAFRSTKG